MLCWVSKTTMVDKLINQMLRCIYFKGSNETVNSLKMSENKSMSYCVQI